MDITYIISHPCTFEGVALTRRQRAALCAAIHYHYAETNRQTDIRRLPGSKQGQEKAEIPEHQRRESPGVGLDSPYDERRE